MMVSSLVLPIAYSSLYSSQILRSSIHQPLPSLVVQNASSPFQLDNVLRLHFLEFLPRRLVDVRDTDRSAYNGDNRMAVR